MTLPKSETETGLPDAAGAQVEGRAPQQGRDAMIHDPALLSGPELFALANAIPAGHAAAGDVPQPAVAGTLASESEQGVNNAALALALLRALDNPVFLMDPDGRVTYMNPGAATHLSQGGKTSVRGWRDLWPEASAEVLGDLMQQAREGESNDVCLPGLTADGAVTLWQISFAPLEDSQGRVAKILCIMRES